jgi:vancomycin resistance protein YoaR
MAAPLLVAHVEPSVEPALDSGAAPLVRSRPPLLLRDERTGLEMALDPATLDDIAPLSAQSASTAPVVDESRLTAILTNWAAQFNLPARDARLRFDPATQSVSVLQPSRAGRRLDVQATLEGVVGAISLGATQAPLVVEQIAPAVDMNRVAEMGIRELVATGSTYFAGSSPERVRNIEVGAAKLDGVVIPPNGIFSFNKYVEDVSAANGFEDSLIIWGDRTAVGIGGGICQVSTTVFRAAFYGGMPMVERYNHGYIVDWYGEPGLDATIFTPSVDFRFRNDTSAYLLIRAGG